MGEEPSLLAGAAWQFLHWKPVSDFQIKIDPRFPDCNRDCDPNQKPIRKNRRSIFLLKSDPEFIFSIAIVIPIKNVPEKSGIDFHGEFDQRFLYENLSAISGSKSDPNRFLPVQPNPRPPPVRHSREDCAKRSPKSPPIACFSGPYDNISAKTGTPVSEIGHFSPRSPF
jgi:hypothetical protein